MKLFLKNVSLFLALSLTLFALEFGLLDYINNRQLAKFNLEPGIESLTVGDSHAELAINDKLLGNNLNLSQRGDPFNYSLLKIKLALQKKPTIKKIYLGVSYHNLSTYCDQYISGNMAAGIDARYIFILPIQKKIAILKENLSDLLVLLRLTFINGLSNAHTDQSKLSFLGKYTNPYNNCKAIRNDIDKRVIDQFYENGNVRAFSVVNSYYLDEIIQLCKKQHIELVFLNTPLHPYYKSKIPGKFIDRYNSLVTQHKLKVIDFSDLSLPDSCFTPDGDHVSVKGALLTTNRLLKADSFNKDNLVQR